MLNIHTAMAQESEAIYTFYPSCRKYDELLALAFPSLPVTLIKIQVH